MIFILICILILLLLIGYTMNTIQKFLLSFVLFNVVAISGAFAPLLAEQGSGSNSHILGVNISVSDDMEAFLFSGEMIYAPDIGSDCYRFRNLQPLVYDSVNVRVDVVFDNFYYGSLTGSCSYSSPTINLGSKTVYFNGNTASFIFNDVDTRYGSLSSSHFTFSLSNYNFFANPQHLNISVDSLSSLSPLFNNFEFVNLFNFDGFAYPFFNSDTSHNIVNYNLSTFSNSWVLIMMCNFRVSSLNVFNNLFDYPTDKFTVSFDRWNSSETFNVYKVVFTKIDTSIAITNLTVKFKRSGVPFTVVFSDYLRSYYNVSTDFALQFRLNNQLLNDLHIISSGDNSSSPNINNMNNELNNFNNVSNELDTISSDLTSDFNSNIDNLPSIDISGNFFGDKFLNSAQFVREQFDNLTLNNPFGSVLQFSLFLGVALLIFRRLL